MKYNPHTSSHAAVSVRMEGGGQKFLHNYGNIETFVFLVFSAASLQQSLTVIMAGLCAVFQLCPHSNMLYLDI